MFKSLRIKLRTLWAKLVVAAALILIVPWVCAQDGLEGALSRANLALPPNLGTPFSQTLAAADFDGDNKPDGAFLVDYGWLRPQSGIRTIELHFTGRRNTHLSFESNESTLAILALDVNRDGATDIVIEQPFTHKHRQVWLNDGRGGFRKVRSEDFPSPDADNHEGLKSPSERPDCPALSLPSQRGSEVATLMPGPIQARPPSARDLKFFSEGFSAASTSHSPDSSRAPPPSPSR